MTDQAAEGPWRVGRRVPIHVYEGDRPVATFHNADDARAAMLAVNTVRSGLLDGDVPEKIRRDTWREALEGAAQAIEGEQLHDDTGDLQDRGYRNGIRDAAQAVRDLISEAGGRDD
ncbi:hypothetical protein [Enterococcus hirae]|uniref:hypothetical protein n=1 Tax=Enterococcus hirae TaxID=1354 RepID=UPI001370E862|nr:hypothetical protein [Enterococcus hirae]NAE18016.1 hypothetical protein [Enterococcus hirae]